MARLRVGVLFGGRSAEHEVSILSARNVVAALDPSRFEPVLIGIDKTGRFRLHGPRALDLAHGQARGDPRLLKLNSAAPTVSIEPWPQGGELTAASPQRVDVVFPVLHGPMGEDGTVQGLLELADIPYVGAGVLGSAVGMDKDITKRLLRDAGIPVARFHTVRKSDYVRDPVRVCAQAAELGFPLFTKPANLGSSVGIRRVLQAGELASALDYALQFDQKALAEAAVVPAREIECSVLGNEDAQASVPGEIVVQSPDGFYSYDAKYVDENGALLIIPAELDAATVRRIQNLAVKTFQVLECQGLARVDFFLRPSGELLVNEINTIPGFTAISMYPKLWETIGLSARELTTRLIDLALARHAARKQLRVFQDL